MQEEDDTENGWLDKWCETSLDFSMENKGEMMVRVCMRQILSRLFHFNITT